MSQTNISEENKLIIDFDRPGIPVSAGILQPVVYKDGDQYHCVFDDDKAAGISGSGETPERALQEWDKKIQLRCTAGASDELSQYIIQKLGNSAATADHKDPADPHRASQEGTKVKEGTAAATHFSPANPVKNNSRKLTTDEANTNGSE